MSMLEYNMSMKMKMKMKMKMSNVTMRIPTRNKDSAIPEA